MTAATATVCCSDGTAGHLVIVALDSVIGHACSERNGARVEVPVLFKGGGQCTYCPYCHQSV